MPFYKEYKKEELKLSELEEVQVSFQQPTQLKIISEIGTKETLKKLAWELCHSLIIATK